MAFSETNKNLSFSCLPFSSLSSKDLYQIIQLREKVFIVEQECAYLDCDGKDIQSYHLSGFLDKSLIAYARLVPAGISYDNFASIGRIVVHEKYRSFGIGKKLVEKSIQYCHKLFPNKKIKISAQCYLKDFYQELGFAAVGDEYQEDGIPHITMIFTS
jgi:ElaA protein